jgi:hypothetical protein
VFRGLAQCCPLYISVLFWCTEHTLCPEDRESNSGNDVPDWTVWHELLEHYISFPVLTRPSPGYVRARWGGGGGLRNREGGASGRNCVTKSEGHSHSVGAASCDLLQNLPFWRAYLSECFLSGHVSSMTLQCWQYRNSGMKQGETKKVTQAMLVDGTGRNVWNYTNIWNSFEKCDKGHVWGMVVRDQNYTLEETGTDVCCVPVHNLLFSCLLYKI